MATTKKVASRKTNQAKVISDLDNQLKKLTYDANQWYENWQICSQDLNKVRAELTEAQIAVLDSVAIIRYLEKKIFDLMKGIQK